MSSLRWRKVLRDLWLHKARTLLVVLAIALGIVGAGSVLDTWALLRRVTRDGFLATNPASATLRTESIDADLLERVRALPEIAAAAARRTVIASAFTESGWRTAVLYAATDFQSPIGKLQPTAGAWPPADSALVIEASSVEFAGLGVGGALQLRLGDRQVTLPIVGIARDAGLAPGWMEHTVYGFVTPATLGLMGAPVTPNQLQILVRDRSLDREAIRALAFRVKAVVEGTGRRVTDVAVPEPGEHIHAAQINSLLFTQGAFGFLALLLSGFLVVNLVAAMLAGQVREIGIMKAIGAGSGQLAAMYLSLALGLGLLACVVAIPAAALLGRWYAEFTAQLLNFDTTGFAIPRWALLVEVLLGALLPVAAAAIPVARGARISVGEALREVGIDGAGRPPGFLLTRVGGLGRPLLLSLRNAFRRRQRMALTLVTLATGGAVYLGALNLRASIRRSVDVLFNEEMRFHLSIRFPEAHRPDSLEAAIAAVPGVVAAEGWGGRRAAVSHGDLVGNGFPVTGLPPQSRMVAYPVRAGRWLQPGDSTALVINRSLAHDEPALAVGQEVTLVIDGRPTRWTVVGVVMTLAGPAAYAPRATLAAIGGDGRVATVVVSTADPAPRAQAELSRRIRAELNGRGLPIASSQPMAESRRVLEDHLLLVAGFLLIMSQLMIVVGGLGLASTMSLAVLERTREIGVLRAIGARHGAILALVQIEGLVIGLLSWLLAIPLSVPMSAILGAAFGRIMTPVPLTLLPDGAGVGLWLAVVVGVSLVASAWPAVRATRITTAAALAYE